MTDENKPPDAAQVSPVWVMGRGASVLARVPGAAHIVLTLLPDEQVHMQSFCFGQINSRGPNTTDARLLAKDLPLSLAELRHELKHQRHCTHAEGLAFAKHYIHGQPLVLSPETDGELMPLAKVG